MREGDSFETYESIVERRIREAQEQGAFDDLPGAGRPLRGLHAPDDENWWLRSYLERHGVSRSVLLPTGLRLRREIEDLPATVGDLATEQEVRAVVADLARRVAAYRRAPDGPRVTVTLPRADDVVAAWQQARHPPISDALSACYPHFAEAFNVSDSPSSTSRWARWRARLRRR